MGLRLRSDEGVSNIFWEDAISMFGIGLGLELELDWSGLGDGGSDGGGCPSIKGTYGSLRNPPLCPPCRAGSVWQKSTTNLHCKQSVFNRILAPEKWLYYSYYVYYLYYFLAL